MFITFTVLENRFVSKSDAIEECERGIEVLFSSTLDEIYVKINQVISEKKPGNELSFQEHFTSNEYSLLSWVLNSQPELLNIVDKKKPRTTFTTRGFNNDLFMEVFLDDYYFLFSLSRKNIENKMNNIPLKEKIDFTIFNESYNVMYSNNMMKKYNVDLISNLHKFYSYPLFLHVDYNINNIRKIDKKSIVIITIGISILTILHMIFYVILRNSFIKLSNFSLTSTKLPPPKEVTILYNKMKKIIHSNTQQNIKIQNFSLLTQKLKESKESITLTCGQLQGLLKEAITQKNEAIIAHKNKTKELQTVIEEYNEKTREKSSKMHLITKNLLFACAEIEIILVKSRSYFLTLHKKNSALVEYAGNTRLFLNYLRYQLNNLIILLQLHLRSFQLKQEEVSLLPVIENCLDMIDYDCHLNQKLEKNINIVKIDVLQIQLLILQKINLLLKTSKDSLINIKCYKVHNIAKIEISASHSDITTLKKILNGSLFLKVANQILFLHNGLFTYYCHKDKCLFIMELPLVSNNAH